MNGIVTLANDRIFDQLVALLNSIEAIMGKTMPVCVYPYDDNTPKIALEIAQRPNVELYSDRDSLHRWETFAKAAWDTHPTARQRWLKAGSEGYHRLGTHYRYCAFDAPFDRFLYMDGDTLLMDNVDFIFEQLDRQDCVVYDFQHKDLTHVYDVSSPLLPRVFSPERLQSEIFCSGLYASKKGLFGENLRQELIERLKAGEGEILYAMAPDQTLVNYMMMRSQKSIYNFAIELPSAQKTGCCVTSPHFTEIDHILYDKGQRLTYLHYIGLSSSLFSKVCAGENIEFPYRDVFLHYRYLHEPDRRPQFSSKARSPQPQKSLNQILRGKLDRLFNKSI